jgi:hypothetical protein
LPSALALWWVGLGIDPIFNPVCRATENPKVERCNGTVNRWGEPRQCSDYAAWEQKVAWVAHTQREKYPAVGKQSRLAAYPGLSVRARPYEAPRERERWKLERVTAYLAEGLWPRQVSDQGQISIYGKAYRAGRPYAGQTVWLRLDAERREWVVQGKNGEELARHEADQLTTERICQLQVSKPHASSKKRRRHNLPPPPAP